MKINRGVAVALTGFLLLMGKTASAQNQPQKLVVTSDIGGEDQSVQLFRKDVRSLKKQLIAANIELTDGEAEQFWPIYDRYTSEMTAIFDKKFTLLQDYARNYQTLTSEQADAYIQGRAEVEQALLQLRIKYFPVFRKVLSGRTTALFYQLDWRIGLVVDLQLSSQVPMIEP